MRRRIVAATPLICLIIYLCCGFIGGIWHPTWLVFLMIPIIPFLLGVKKLQHVYPLICVIAYIIIGIVWECWHPGWIIFLTIPVYYILFPTYLRKKQTTRIE